MATLLEPLRPKVLFSGWIFSIQALRVTNINGPSDEYRKNCTEVNLSFMSKPLISVLNHINLVHTLPSYDPFLYIQVFQVISFLQVFQSKLCMHFISAPCIPFASP
jgi:hypothetical protein